MRFGTHEHVRGFDADHKIVIALFLDHVHFIQRTLHDPFCRNTMIFLYQVFFQRTTVDTYSDGDIPLLRSLHYSVQTLSAADISRIDTDLVCPVFHGSNSQAIIKMDICHQRDTDFLFDFADGSSSLLCWNGTADDVTARCCQLPDLLHGSCHVLCLCIRHGLDQDGISPTDDPVSDMDYFCMVTIHLIHPFFFYLLL